MDVQFFKKLSLPKTLGFLTKSPLSIAGVDIGTSSIKVVQLKREKEKAILETYGALAVGSYANLAIGQAAYLTETKAVEVIKDLFKEAGVKTRDVAVSIGLRNTFVTTIELPSAIKGNLGDIVAIEARKYIPLPISEVALDWWMIPKIFEPNAGSDSLPKKDTVEVLLVAIYRDAIEVYKRIFSKAGLNIRLFEIEIFSAIRSCVGREVSPVLLFDFGASVSKMAIVDSGIVRLVHTFDKGAQDLTAALSTSLGVDFRAAEEMKHEIGFSSRPEHREIASVLEPITNYVFSEGKRFIGDYRRRYGRSVGKVVLTGGGALLKGITNVAVKSFGVETVAGDSFSKAEYPAFLHGVLKEAGPTFSIAMGLALRGLQSS